ncbi:MAG: tetratricopeptide repeat protein, partial [Acidobacteriota bacterium]
MALKTEKVIKNAEKYVAKGKLEAAIKEYRKVLAQNPSDINTLNRVGDLYARLERYDEAVKLFTQIAEKYTRDGFFLKAIAIYKKIIKLDPTALAVYERLAELYHRQGLLNEARTQYQVLADYYQKHENATSAITIYQRMSEIEPDNPTFHLKLAELFASQRLTEKALKEYQALVEVMLAAGSIDETAAVYGKAMELAPDHLDFIRQAVKTLHEAGHVGVAAKVLARATELNPEASKVAVEVGLGPKEPEPEPEPEPAPAPAPEPEPAPAPQASSVDAWSTEPDFA